ncbi:MAG: hypothetical protein IPH10_14420 [bacterium]|nr:hypothetical protein [bacterium]
MTGPRLLNVAVGCHPELYFEWEKTHFEGHPLSSLIGRDSHACITMEEMKTIACEYHQIPEERVEDREAFLKKHEGTVILVKWTETYEQSTCESRSAIIEALSSIAGGTVHAQDVRMVFWFDN